MSEAGAPVRRKTRLRNGEYAADPRLGRVVSETMEHVEKYPLRALALSEQPRNVPGFIGVNWYRNFYADRLIQRRGSGGRFEWWVQEGDLGALLGGHAITLEPFSGPRDLDSWWRWHNQVSEGICVSENQARGMAILNRKKYQPRPLYDSAQLIDEWAGEDYSGTSVRAGLEVNRTLGLVPAKRGERHFILKGEVSRQPVAAEGIAAYRWAVNIEEMLRALGDANRQYATWLNSWGTGYPHRVKVPVSVLARLLAEDGEFGIVTDR